MPQIRGSSYSYSLLPTPSSYLIPISASVSVTSLWALM